MMVSKKHSHWAIDNEGHHNIHVSNILRQVRIGQVQFCASKKGEQYISYTNIFVINTSSYRYKHILVHVGFLSVDMDYSINHLATISCVGRHIIGVLVIGVCL